MQFTYKKAILGGTFDRLHRGHHQLIDTTFEQAERVTIGITLPDLYKNKFLAETIENYTVREEHVKNYLSKKNYLSRAKIIPIDNIYGTTLKESDIDAIFATEENINNVELINAKRQEIGFPKLNIIIVPYIKDENGEKITSERIRKGEIDSNGLVYKNVFAGRQTLIMPESSREELQKPLSQIYKNTTDILLFLDKKIIITIGDIITSELKKKGITPAISIIDFKTRRHELPRLELIDSINVKNEHGTINIEAVNSFIIALDKYFRTNKPQTIIVDGEEDLLALPAILLAPLDSLVLYGQFDQGIVVNVVSSELKEKVRQLLNKFQIM
ncbi:pantetheine-phosphate adenylyltransferase [Candidatus Roizmanbacteria bacterium]|nr:pantetheine-phosphate adenylyltransferase [Candidatus Roizmanbacteria bacterium]